MTARRGILRETLLAACAVLLLFAGLRPAAAQADAAGLGPGSYLQIGAAFSDFQVDYGQRYIQGGSIFVDAHLYRRIGAEVEARNFRYNEDAGTHETTYLVGPRLSVFPRRLRPYVKLLAGRGQFYFPYGYAKGSYLVVAAGAGVDWHPRGSRLSLRLIDFEQQDWPNFSFGALHPYGISTGLALRIF